ncbi:MAG TPA: cytochrome c [Bryobacteraceae bacterium]|nr:cytochrome c [Bryobacteraceae bacterium]
MTPQIAMAVVSFAVLTGCRQDMQNAPRYRTFQKSTFFADGLSSRPQLPGTVAQEQFGSDELLNTGKVNGQLADVFPFPVTKEVIRRGQERFNIYCAPCHSRLGDGEGMIVQRGFRKPPSYHIDRLRNAPVGHFFDVITNGFGAMTDYAARVPPRDRWAITAYIRALQFSRTASASDVPADQQAKLGEAPVTPHGLEAGTTGTAAAAPAGPSQSAPREPQPSEVRPGSQPGPRRDAPEKPGEQR